MAILEDAALRRAMDPSVPLQRRLVVTPLLDEKRQIGPASIDVRLGSDFLILRRLDRCGLDPVAEQSSGAVEAQPPIRIPLGGSVWLQPQQFMLGATLEFIRVPSHLAATVIGRSSWGRMGLVVATAVMVQPGYAGSLTLELANEGDSPIRLYPGLRVAQLLVYATEGPAENPYDPRTANYSFPVGPGLPKAAWHADELDRVARMRQQLGLA